MKHLVLLTVLVLAAYFWWRYAAKRERKVTKKFLGTHLPWVIGILAAVFGALVAMKTGGSISIL